MKSRRFVGKRRRRAARLLEDLMSANHLGAEDRQIIRESVAFFRQCAVSYPSEGRILKMETATQVITVTKHGLS